MRRLLPAVLVLLPVLAPAGVAREVRLLMGTTAEVEVDVPGDPGPAVAAAFAALGLVDDSMSLWKPSELTRLNEIRSGIASPELFHVVQAALEIAQASGGAFDPTAGSRVVGHRRVTLDSRSRRVTLAEGTRLDLGAIAKGYAVDLALEAARARGARAALVDLGQSSLGSFGRAVEVLVRDPEDPEAPPWGRFELGDGWALSTSGGDQRPGHILDPRRGKPATSVLAATVLARTAMEADALSTAVFVLGPERGLAFLERRGARGFVLVRKGSRRILRASHGFPAGHHLRTAPGVTLRP